MNELNTTAISLSVDGQMFPVAYELPFPPSVVIEYLGKLGEMKEVSNRFKPVLVPDRSGFAALNAADILYLEADGSYCRIHLRNGEKILLSEPLGVLVDDFCYCGIVRCHNSCAVNINEIAFIGGNFIRMKNEKTIKFGRTYKGKVHGRFNHRGTKSGEY